jgi:hypothetical protein
MRSNIIRAIWVISFVRLILNKAGDSDPDDCWYFRSISYLNNPSSHRNASWVFAFRIAPPKNSNDHRFSIDRNPTLSLLLHPELLVFHFPLCSLHRLWLRIALYGLPQERMVVFPLQKGHGLRNHHVLLQRGLDSLHHYIKDIWKPRKSIAGYIG